MISAFPLAWPDGWKRTPAGIRTRARFATKERQYASTPGGGSWMRAREVTIYDATNRLRSELERFGVARDDFVISTNLKLRLDGFPASTQREPDDPGAAVYWRRVEDQAMRCMAIDRYDRVADNLAAIAATLDAMRAIERHGGAQILERAFTGFTALPGPGQTTGPSWRDVFGHDVLTRDALDMRYRALRSQAHPDKGGTAERFHAVQRAYEIAVQEVLA